MNWGHKLLIGFLAFVFMIIGMVYVAMQQNIEMQDDNYYSKELAYQTVIDGKNNLKAMHDEVQINVNDTFVEISIPEAAATSVENGKIRFLRPSDATKDVLLPLELDEQNTQKIPIQKFIKGTYSLQLSWTSKNLPYYFERSVYI
ncbi:MAG: FixH family protein [Chitinophagales bacterium]|nr:FixH family protein [Bacteroidota bacterium]